MAEKEIPRGFIRKELRACGGLVDMPGSWFFNHQAGGFGGHSFYLTRENLKKRGYFTIGTTIMYAPGRLLKALGEGEDVRGLFDKMVAPMKDAMQVEAEEPQESEDEDFNHFDVPVVGTSKKAMTLHAFGDLNSANLVNIPSVTTLSRISINKHTGTTYIATFEAPTDLWEKHIETGKAILDSIQYDPAR